MSIKFSAEKDEKWMRQKVTNMVFVAHFGNFGPTGPRPINMTLMKIVEFFF